MAASRIRKPGRAGIRDDARYRLAERAAWAHHGMSPREVWIEVPELALRMRALLHGEGRPVVFIHGNPTTGNVFIPLVAALPGITSIVLDRPGCGLSDPLDYLGMTPQDLEHAVATYVAAAIDQVADGRADLVGNSAGGGAALIAAERHPARVRSIVLEGVPAVQGMRLTRAVRATAVPAIAAMVARHRVTERDLRRSFRVMGHGTLLDAGGLASEDLAWRIALSLHTETLRHELSLVRRAATWRGLRPDWFPGRRTLEAITSPSIWIAGDKDPFATPARVRAWAAHAAGSQVRIMPDSGHQPWLDDPEGHAAMLEEFWSHATPHAA